jgi:hypothetical protein
MMGKMNSTIDMYCGTPAATISGVTRRKNSRITGKASARLAMKVIAVSSRPPK